MSSSIGRLALGVVGALIGAPFGLAAVGFSIGSAIGGLLFAPEGPTVEGPRLGDTDVTASSLGKIIPYQYGVTRSAGNVIWSAGLKEVKTEEQQGGKGGGGGSTQVTYEYFASFATAFGRGPAQDILRMWADGKLIYDVTGTGTSTSDSAPEFNFRFINGGDNTDVDPLIAESINRRLAGLPDINEGNGPQSSYNTIDDLIQQAADSGDARSDIYASYLTQLKTNAEGVGGTPPDYGFTPAYKEMCYVVFDDMPLANFGNRIPNITAEIVWSNDSTILASDTVVETALTEISGDTTVPTSGMGVDILTRSLLVKGSTRIRRFASGTNAETAEAAATQSTGLIAATVEDILCADGNGDFIARMSRSGTSSDPIIGKVTNTGLEILGVADTFTMDSNAAAATFAAAAGQNGNRTLVAGCDSTGRFYIYEVGSDALSVIWGLSAPNTFTGTGDGPMVGSGTSGETNVHWLADDGTNWTLYQVGITFGASGTPTVDFTTLDSGLLVTEVPRGLVFDSATQSINAFFQVGSAGRIKQYDPDAAGTGSDPYLQYTAELTHTPPAPTSGFSRSVATSSRVAYAVGTDAVFVDLSDGTETVDTGVLSSAASADVQVYLGVFSSMYTWMSGTPTRTQFSRLDPALYSTDLATVITDICTRTGMQSDEFDVSEIEGQFSVRGFTLGRTSSGRKALENLLLAYFVDGIETDWEVKFRERTTTAVRTIEESELGAIKSPTGDVHILEMRQPEYELPSEIAMAFTDQARDYQQGSAHYRRTSNPAPAMHSNKTETIEMPLVLLEHEARSITQRLMFLTWMSRDTTKARLPWTHADLDPTDVIKYSLNDGRILTDRIARATMGANFEIEVETARSGDPVYTQQPLSTVGSSNIPSNSILAPQYAKMFVFDIPLLYDYHDTARASSRYYAAVGSDSTSFLSADLYNSLDASSYSAFDSATVDVTWGQVVNGALGTPRSLWTTDNDNTLNVTLSVDNGDVNSVTQDEILNGANMALIWNQSTGVGEIIQFQNVTVNGDGTITLDTLVRGRRGTDYAVDQHTTGEFFILLTESALLPETQSLALLGTTQYYKAVSRGSTLGSAPALSTSFEGRDLKPYAPSNVRRTDDGTDLTITWNRRTRLGGEWNMYGTGIETVPINEDSEVYEFFLLPPGQSGLDDFDPANEATYIEKQTWSDETAMVTASTLGVAGYALSDTINVAVYQLSAQVGRGFGRIEALPA